MSITAADFSGTEPPPDPSFDRSGDDTIVVTCGACNTRQQASGRAQGFACAVCGSEWRVLRCQGCHAASIVLAGVRACPRCGHEHPIRGGTIRPDLPSWLTDPEPLSVWIGGVKYLGGHSATDGTVTSAGLLFDRRGIHLRAFAELFTIRWDAVASLDIEGALDIADRLTQSRLLELGATTWALQVSYLTVRTAEGDAIFEVDGLAAPELHARLSRVVQGLRKRDPEHAAIPIERPTAAAEPARAATPEPARHRTFEPPRVVTPAAVPTPGPEPTPAPVPEPVPEPLALDVPRTEAPVEAIVIDALWKLSQLRDQGLVGDSDVSILRDRLLARLADPATAPAPAGTNGHGPLLRV